MRPRGLFIIVPPVLCDYRDLGFPSLFMSVSLSCRRFHGEFGCLFVRFKCIFVHLLSRSKAHGVQCGPCGLMLFPRF